MTSCIGSGQKSNLRQRPSSAYRTHRTVECPGPEDGRRERVVQQNGPTGSPGTGSTTRSPLSRDRRTSRCKRNGNAGRGSRTLRCFFCLRGRRFTARADVFRGWVVSPRGERMAAADAPQTQPTTLEETKALDAHGRVTRARRLVTTHAPQEGRERPPIEADRPQSEAAQHLPRYAPWPEVRQRRVPDAAAPPGRSLPRQPPKAPHCRPSTERISSPSGCPRRSGHRVGERR